MFALSEQTWVTPRPGRAKRPSPDSQSDPHPLTGAVRRTLKRFSVHAARVPNLHAGRGTCGTDRAARRAGGDAAPGAPGAVANWAPGNKEGFGTSTTTAGKAWFTLQGGELSEVYAPDLGTPSLRDLQFVVSDGRTFTERETDGATHVTRLADARSLTYRQVSTASRWRITKTYVVDPARAAVLVDVAFESRTGRPYDLYVLADPALSNTGDDDRGKGMTAWDAKGASAIAADPPLGRESSGYMGASDGWTDLRDDHRMDWTYDAATPATSYSSGPRRSTASSGGT